MADQSNSEPADPLVPAKEDGGRQGQLDLAGENILNLLHKAADLAEGNSRYAVDIAQRLSHQLFAAEKRTAELEDRIAELEAEVQLYREKSERAECARTIAISVSPSTAALLPTFWFRISATCLITRRCPRTSHRHRTDCPAAGMAA